jgi:hypothetical protein
MKNSSNEFRIGFDEQDQFEKVTFCYPNGMPRLEVSVNGLEAILDYCMRNGQDLSQDPIELIEHLGDLDFSELQDLIEKVENEEEIFESNWEKFEELRELQLPMGHYAIISSGPLGIRNLREIGDVDILVTPELWARLSALYGVKDEGGVKKIRFPESDIEAFTDGSFYSQPKLSDEPTVADRIAKADIIEDLPFESLEYVLYYKRLLKRDKDLRDIDLIEGWLKTQ